MTSPQQTVQIETLMILGFNSALLDIFALNYTHTSTQSIERDTLTCDLFGSHGHKIRSVAALKTNWRQTRRCLKADPSFPPRVPAGKWRGPLSPNNFLI